jgi:hypothetical protein
MGRLAVAIALLAALVPGPGSAKTAVLVTVDKSHQRMTVSVDGIPRYSWDISTGRVPGTNRLLPRLDTGFVDADERRVECGFPLLRLRFLSPSVGALQQQ